MQLCPLGPRSGITSAAGLLTLGSTPSGAFPSRLSGQWLAHALLPRRVGTGLAITLPKDSPITVTGPCLNHTGFPILLDGFSDPRQIIHRDTARYSVSVRKVRLCLFESQRQRFPDRLRNGLTSLVTFPLN